MIDCGSKVNVIGEETKEEQKHKWRAAGFEEEEIPRKTLLKISGVGSGAALWKKEVRFPMAVEFEGAATLETMKANVAEGSGAHLPCILGLDSMTEKNCFILLQKGHQKLALPGPGGYKIEWSPGTKLLPIENLPSGHLGFTTDNYDKVVNNKSEQLSFITDHTTSLFTCK